MRPDPSDAPVSGITNSSSDGAPVRIFGGCCGWIVVRFMICLRSYISHCNRWDDDRLKLTCDKGSIACDSCFPSVPEDLGALFAWLPESDGMYFGWLFPFEIGRAAIPVSQSSCIDGSLLRVRRRGCSHTFTIFRGSLHFGSAVGSRLQCQACQCFSSNGAFLGMGRWVCGHSDLRCLFCHCCGGPSPNGGEWLMFYRNGANPAYTSLSSSDIVYCLMSL